MDALQRTARDAGLQQAESVLSATRQLISGDIADLLQPTAARIRTATLECRIAVRKASDDRQTDPFAMQPSLRVAIRDIQRGHGTALAKLRDELCRLQKRQSDRHEALKAAALAERVQASLAGLAKWWQEAAELVLGMFRKLGLERLQRLALISQVIDLLPDEAQILDPLRTEIEMETGIVALARAIATPQQATYR